MKSLLRSVCMSLMTAALLLMILPTEALSQRGRGGGSFGGSRSSGRSFSAPRSSPRGGGSFGGSRQSYNSRSRDYSAPRSRSSSPSMGSPTSAQRNGFGGSRLGTKQEYTSRYGTPRKVETARVPTSAGATNYQVNRYGGMGDGFMMGYLMGSIPWYYSMPFHPAFYYSRPYTVANADGTVGVYPGTFQWGQLFFVLLLVAGGGYILYVWIRSKRRRRESGGVDYSRSSFE